MTTEPRFHPFVVFMAGPAGRWLRIVAGLFLAGLGLWVAGGTAHIVLLVVGAVVFAAGALNVCVFGPIFGAPFSGSRVRN
jgi:hypothetical protein